MAGEDVKIAVLEQRIDYLEARLHAKEEKLDALEANYNKMINRGAGGVLVLGSFGAFIGWIVSLAKPFGGHP